MGWGQSWPTKTPRPKVKKQTDDEKQKILAAMERAIARSPVMTALKVEAHARRGRYYLERPYEYRGEKGREILGRISPLVRAKDDLILEIEGRSDWSQVGKGKIQKLMGLVENDKQGRFHGLGSLNKSLRSSGGERIAVEKTGVTFVYQESGEECSSQEALFHYFGVPIEVIAEPRQWYIYHRRPYIREASADGTQVLVDFVKGGLSGSFGGTVLYMTKDGGWHFFTIKPSSSKSIEEAEKWIKKRNWDDWGN